MYIFLTCAHRTQCFFSWIPNVLPFTFGINFVKIHLLKHPSHRFGVTSPSSRSKWKSKRNGDRVVRWPTLTFKGTCFPIFGIWPWSSDKLIALSVRQQTKPWPLAIQIWKFNGVCHAQIISNYPDSLQNQWKCHGKFHIPLPHYYVAGEYYSHVLEYLFRSKHDNLSEYFHGGLVRSIELTIGLPPTGFS